MTRFKTILSTILLGCLCIILNAQVNGDNYALLLRSGEQLFPENTRNFNPQNAFIRSELIAGQYYRILQFYNIPSPKEQAKIAELGIELLSYLPHKAYIAALPSDLNFQELRRLGLRSVINIREQYKLAPQLQETISNASSASMTLAVQYHKNLPTAIINRFLKQSEYEVLNRYPEQHMVLIEAPATSIEQLAALPMVAYVESVQEKAESEDLGGRHLHRSNTLFSDYAGGICYDGSGVHVAIGDDGFIGPHIDFRGRLEQESAVGELEGEHGEIVAGIFTGSGNLNPQMKGMAPGAFLHVYNGFAAVKTGTNNPIHEKIVVTSTSYGDGCNRGYTLFTALADHQVRDDGALIHVFSAGNAGDQDCGYGAGSGWGNITGGIKVGKNVIAVANLDGNDRRVANSSRGPTTDGRIKPDISANGSGQMSTAPENTYTTASGTSVAAPGVAGVLAQLYEAFRDINDGNNPESALMKAALLNSAEDLGPKGPDFSYGWGRVNARRALEVLQHKRYFRGSIEQSEKQIHDLPLLDGAAQLRVMLYWHDIEGTSYSGRDLVNNLDLLLITPKGDTIKPWVLDPTPDPQRLAKEAVRGIDRLNNMEQVTLNLANRGGYKLQVSGTGVAVGPQSYYIVYEWRDEEVTLTYPFGGEQLVPGEVERLHWDAYGNTGSFTLSFSDNNGENWEEIQTLSGDSRRYDWLVPERISGKAKIRISRDGYSDENVAPFSIFKIPEKLKVEKVCPGFVRLSWNVLEDATAYMIYRLGDQFMESIATVTNTNIEIINDDPMVEQWYAVQALGIDGACSRRSLAISDGVSLKDCAVDADVGLIKINSPAAVTYQNCFGQPLLVSANIKNTGNRLQSNFPVCYQLNGQAMICEQYSSSIPSGVTINYSFASALENLEPGLNQLKIWTDMSGDEAGFNDTIIRNLRVAESELVALPYFEYFEGFAACPSNGQCVETCDLQGGWTNVVNRGDDDIDWKIHSGPTPTYGTGPSTDQNTRTQNGQYLYLEGSGGCFNRTAALLSPCFDLRNVNNPILSFWYHMFGDHIGQLTVDLFEGETWHTNIVLPIHGNQGNRWQKAEVDLSSLAGKIASIQFTGQTGDNYLTDMAIDNVALFDANSPPISAFTISKSATCPEQIIELQDNSFNSPTEWLWEVSPSSGVVFVDGTSASSPNPKVYFIEDNIYTLSLTTFNSFGSNQATSVTNFIDISQGVDLPVQENFDSPLMDFVDNWTVNNPDEFISWELHPVIGAQGLSTQAIYVANHSYNARGEEDELVSATIDLKEAAFPLLKFDYSYAAYSAQYADGLQVLLAPNCEAEFTESLFDQKGVNLSTVDISSNGWVPQKASDWKTVLIDLSDYAGQSIKLKFVNTCGFGNNLYLDNILVYEQNDLPQAGFTFSTEEEAVCEGQIVHFSNTTIGGIANNYSWNFGEAASPQLATGPGPHEVTYSNAGNYPVELIVNNTLGGSESRKVVEVLDKVSAYFSFQKSGMLVEFLNESIEADSFHWDFGDGHYSSERNPVHEYLIDDRYTVYLEAFNSCSSELIARDIKVSTSTHQPNGEGSIQLYPNPAHSSVYLLSSNQYFKQIAVDIYDLHGREILTINQLELEQQKALRLDISQLSAGTYFIRIRNGAHLQVNRLLVNR